jgi:sugar lactone lactonase YvrE
MRALILSLLVAITCCPTSALAQIQDGYTTLTADPGAPQPAGAALFSYTNPDGVLVSQAGVGASTLIQSGRIFIDEAGALTGIALVNPSAQDASVSLTLRDAAGTKIDGNVIPLAAHQHTARFISELFPNRPANLTGTLTFDSNQSLAAITLRQTSNAQGEPVYTTIPVLDLNAPAGSGAVVFPQIAVGSGFTTQVLLMNGGSQRLHGRVDFISSDGSALSVRSDSGAITSLLYDIQPQGIYRAEVDGLGPVTDGYAVLTPDPGTASPSGTAVFRFKSGANIVTEAGVAAGTATSAARIYVDYIGTQTGVALANPADAPATLTLTLLDRFGTTETSIQQVLPPRTHSAKFVHEIFPTVADGYTGLVEIRSTSPIVSLALKVTTNSRSDLVLATLPAADLTLPATGGSIVFPHIVIGGGFDTRLLLINTSTATASSGQLAFFKSDGSAFSVPMAGQTGNQFGYRIAQGGGRQLYPGNPATVKNISLIGDPLSVQITSELLVNVGNTARARVQMIDNTGARRDDFDPNVTSLDTTIADVPDPSGIIRGNKPGFSTLTITAGDAIASVTATVVQVDAGVTGFATAGIAQDGARRLYLSSSTDNVVLLAQDLKQPPQPYAGMTGTAGLKDDIRSQSLFNRPSFLVLNQADGSLYLSDAANNVIRRVRSGPAGHVETLAGSGTAGFADGTAKTASFNNPQGVALDAKGNLWVADAGNHTIRRINLATGIVTTVAGRAGAPGVVDGTGTAARFNSPAGIAVEVETAAQALQRQLHGTPPPPVSVIVADSGNGRIRRVKETGEVVTVRTNASSVSSLVNARLSARATGDPAPAIFSTPTGVAIDPAGNIYVAQPDSGEVRVLLQTGAIVPAAQAGTFDTPRSVAVAENGKVLVTGTGPAARQLVYGQPQISAVSPARFSSKGGQSVTINGSNFSPDTVIIIGDTVIANPDVADTQTIKFAVPALLSGRSTLTVSNRGGTAQTVVTIDAVPFNQLPIGYITTAAGGSTYAGEGALATASPIEPASVVFDANGNVFILDGLNAKVRKVDSRTGIMTTILGNGQGISSGDNGPAVAAGIKSYATAIGLDPAGNLLIADSGIRRIDAATGIIKTIAVTQYGFCGDGEDALNACVNDATGFTTDAQGNLYIADRFNHRVRRVDAKTNIITTFAGNGQGAFAGDNGDAAAASLNEPFGVAVDDVRGAVYIADSANGRVRKVDLATHIITTVAGTGTRSDDIGDGGQGILASVSPNALALDSAGNLFISDRGNSRIRKLDVSTGIITTFAGSSAIGSDGDGGLATDASLGDPFGIAIDAAGDLLIADSSKFVLRRVDGSTHIITTFAGNRQDEIADDGGPATAAVLRLPEAVTIDSAGNLFFASNFRIRRVDSATGIIQTIAGGGEFSGSQADGGPATKAQMQPGSGRVAVDDVGNVYIPDRYGNRVRKVQAGTNIISTIAGSDESMSFGDGIPATSAGVLPDGLALDKQGNLYIVETDNPDGVRLVRKVNLPTGVITTVAGGGALPGDSTPATLVKLGGHLRIAVDASGNIYITDPDRGVIRRVDGNTQIIKTVAGGGASYSDGQLATSVSLLPAAADVDAAGNLYILDYSYPGSIRKVDAGTGLIHTLVTFTGDGSTGLGDNGPAGAASVRYPSDVTVDAQGNLFIADTENSRVRVIRGPLP